LTFRPLVYLYSIIDMKSGFIHYFFNASFIVLCLLSVTANAQNATVIENEFIYTTAPFASAHASTIVETKNGKLIAAWFGGKHEGNNDVSIWMSVKEKSGWSKPIQVADGKHTDGVQYPCWNPVLFQARDGKLYLHYKVGKNPREWWALYKVSMDEGKSWSTAIRLPDDLLGPIKNKPIQLDDGSILYGSSIETVTGNRWSIHMEMSDAQASSWKKIPVESDTLEAIQPTIIKHANGSLQTLSRSKHNVLVESWSRDNGRSWSMIKLTKIPNPNSGVDVATLPNGIHLLVYNPTFAGKEWWEGRAVLKLAASVDGIDWKDIHTFEQHDKGEYSYPAIIVGRDGSVHVTYTFNRTKIKYVKLSVE
jgi:predicted neuraminidase